ncbi:MAG: Arc family DNA-binding protein [Burkholderiales bacterium]|nr:Arc family DNA-binding protein [Burkholderiales bacterium]
MGINLSIKEVPETIAERLRQRAARNHRSLQGELMAIIERAAAEPLPEPGAAPAPWAIGGDSWVQGWKTMDQLVAEREAAGWKPDPRMADLPRAVDIIRADRDRR